MTKKAGLYWAYGSNLNVEQMSGRCPGAYPVGPLYLENGALVFRSVADVVIRKGSRVAGGLWRITPEDEAALDRYEGVAFGLYEKRYLTLRVDGKVETCLFYKMKERGIAPPQDNYVLGILQGYRDFKLDTRLLEEALQHSWNRKRKTPALKQRWIRNGRRKLARLILIQGGDDEEERTT